MNSHQIFIDLQTDDDSYVPPEEDIDMWAREALNYQHTQNYEMSICVTHEAAMQQLNTRYRQQHKPTNVLSFCADIPKEISAHLNSAYTLLGDIVICAAVVNHEASQQKKTPQAHWAHMVIHGCLHLLGYDHIDDNDAKVMEALETQILQKLGFAAPYEILNHEIF